jgi:tetratricopeptide (TPR) repeat protein
VPRQAEPRAAEEALSYDPATRTLRSAPVRVTTHSGEDPIYARLQRAYSAYQIGSYEEARRLYREVLARDPANRDAHLGLGAVAVALGETAQAQAVYGRMLAQHPQDRVAAAAASSIAAGAGVPQGEARLRQLVQQDPSAPYLHFALGNLYAAQRRWGEAQQAYFDAVRTDARSPDYAYNLAVSLDHLGQRPAALEYYRRALELSARRPGGFSEAAVRERIDRIELGGDTGAP